MDINKALSPAEAQLSKSVSVPVADIKVPGTEETQFLSKIARDGYLDVGDFFAILAGTHVIDDPNGALMSAAKRIVGLPALPTGQTGTYPDGADLKFHTVQISGGIDIAAVEITPKDPLSSNIPIVFGTGLFHSAALLEPFASRLAIELGRKVILYDLPSVGASQLKPTASVDTAMLTETLESVISKLCPQGNIDVIGFSLSTVGERLLRANPKKLNAGGRFLRRNVFINPVRSMGEAASKEPVNRWFLRSLGVQMVTEGGNLKPTMFDLFFDQNNNPRAKELISREIFRLGLLKFMAILDESDREPILGKDVGSASDVGWIISKGDRLMTDQTAKGRNIIEIDGPHSFMVDERYFAEGINAIRELLDGNQRYGDEILSRTRLLSDIKISTSAELGYSDGFNSAIRGFASLNFPYLQFQSGAGISASYPTDEDRSAIKIYPYSKIAIRGPNSKIGIFARAEARWDPFNPLESWIPAIDAGAEINLWSIASIQGGIHATDQSGSSLSPLLMLSMDL